MIDRLTQFLGVPGWYVVLGLLIAGAALYQLTRSINEHLKTCPICNWEKARFQRRCWRCVRA